MIEPLTGEQAFERESLWTQGRKIVQNAPQLYLDTDIEADGIAGHGSITALGSISPFGETFYSEIKPASKKFVPIQRAFCEQHGLERERLLREAPNFRKVMRAFNQWIHELQQKYEKDSAVMSVANGSFDFSHIDLYFLKAQIENPFGIAPFDIKSISLALSETWDWHETSIGRMPRIILPDRPFTHQALEDSEYQQLAHFGLAALVRRQISSFPQ